MGDGELQPRTVRRAPNPAYIEKAAARPVAVGQAPRQNHDALRRHETSRDDRQGARRTSRRSCFSTSRRAGVDVELRRDMWALVRSLRENGVTIILTTHYIDEAEEMADRIGVINKGELILVEEKTKLMKKLGKKQLTLNLQKPLAALPLELQRLAARAEGRRHRTGIHLRRRRRTRRHSRAAATPDRARHRFQGSEYPPKLAGRYLRQLW